MEVSPNEVLVPWYGDEIEWVTPPEYYSRMLGRFVICNEESCDG